jgi:hypothetical protein
MSEMAQGYVLTSQAARDLMLAIIGWRHVCTALANGKFKSCKAEDRKPVLSSAVPQLRGASLRF